MLARGGQTTGVDSASSDVAGASNARAENSDDTREPPRRPEGFRIKHFCWTDAAIAYVHIRGIRHTLLLLLPRRFKPLNPQIVALRAAVRGHPGRAAAAPVRCGRMHSTRRRGNS